MPLEHISLHANAERPWRRTEIKFWNSSERARKRWRQKTACNYGNSCLQRSFVGSRFKLRSTTKKKKRRAGWSQGRSCRMQESNKLAGRRVKVRTSEREGRREGWRREKELLSHYYPSVTGLMGGCYGYGDSRLSVLLTIAYKASIQRQATMQISFSPFLYFLLFTSSPLPAPPPPHTTTTPATPSMQPPPAVKCFCLAFIFCPSLFPAHSNFHHHRREKIRPRTRKRCSQ